jgi:hypothetical protein
MQLRTDMAAIREVGPNYPYALPLKSFYVSQQPADNDARETYTPRHPNG